jgi:iron complex outermembrane recepter protein
MFHRKTLLAASIIAGLCLAGSAYAADNAPAPQQTGPATNGNGQDNSQNPTDQTKTAADKKQAKELSTVTVVGIRDSQAASLNLKKAADSHIEVITSEDVGKLPAKNVADTLAQLPGVNISDAAGSEGGFDEADRVSLRGSAPSLTLTTVNGHSISSGDWFVLNDNSGRSVSYSMLPAEVVSQVEVYKSSEARLQEGGAAGTVNIVTRQPLEFDKPLTAEASVGGVYADLPGTTKPQFNGLVNWKNSDNTFGVMLQGFYEERALQRDGQEMLGYSYIPASSALATAYPNLAGKYFPNLPGAALFEQTRKRKGGNVDLEWKPLDNLSFNLNGFYSKLNATDVNYNYMLYNYSHLPAATSLSSYSVQNNVLTSATFPGVAGSTPGVYDQISRPGESESSYYITLDADWKVNPDLDFKFQGGTTRGTGNTPEQDVMELNTGSGQAAGYALNGTGTPASWMLGGNNSANTSTNNFSWIFGDQDIHVVDKEQWFQADGEFDFDNAGPLSSLMFGARYSNHTRESLTAIGQSPGCSDGTALNWGATPYYCTAPATSAYDPAVYGTPAGGSYPGSFASDLGVGQMPSNIWTWTPGQLAYLNSLYAYRDPVVRNDWNQLYAVNEHNTAGYLQLNFSSDRWSGNAGFRYVTTRENISYTSPSALESDYSGPIEGSAWGPYYWNYYHKTYGKLLPSFNLKFNLDDSGDLLARFAASQTLTRQDYSQLAGPVNLADPHEEGTLGGGSGSNPELKPLISTNFDAALEWYFAPRGLLSASVFSMDLHNYYDYGTVSRSYLNNYLTYNPTTNPSSAPIYSNYLVSIPVNVNGTIKGVELNYIQPIGENFGVQANYTYTNGHEEGGSLLYNSDGTPANNLAAGSRPLIGNSKNTANFSAFFENAHWNARINYTYRSAFYDGMEVVATGNVPLEPYFQAGQGYLSFSAGYKLNDHVSFAFDAMNLNNPKLRYYDYGYQAGLGFGKEPEAFYVNGRQYYLTATFKL